MATFYLSNSDIGLACEEVGRFLAKVGVDRREALRIKLTFEEVLLEYQAKFGEETSFNARLSKRFSSIKVEIVVGGESFDPLAKPGEEDDVIRGLLAGIGLAPTWSYKNGKNYVIFIPERKPMSGTVKMAVAIGLALVVGFLLNLMPDAVRIGANDYLLTPVTNAFMGLISAVSGPLIFLSVLGSICSMGNLETLGRIGSKTVKILLLYMPVIAVFMSAFACLFYPVKWGGGGTTDFSNILDLIYDIVPSNLFEPFITGNALQLIFISFIAGLAMLVLAMRVRILFALVKQFGAIVQTIMSGLSSMLPILIFALFTGMISSGNFAAILNSWKIVLVIVLTAAAYFVLNLLRIAVMKKVSPVLLFKKSWPTLMICLTTSSSAAAFSTNVRDTNKKFGVDKKLVDFGTPLGQVLFTPGFVAAVMGLSLGFAESCGIEITLPWVTVGCVTSLLVSFAIPPVPGSSMMGFSIVFMQLGIPSEMMGIALAVNAITDFPGTASNVAGWQLSMIDVADSLNMLDKETLRKEI